MKEKIRSQGHLHLILHRAAGKKGNGGDSPSQTDRKRKKGDPGLERRPDNDRKHSIGLALKSHRRARGYKLGDEDRTIGFSGGTIINYKPTS
jgi:hypothetical protein